jgi:hypothetical protein
MLIESCCRCGFVHKDGRIGYRAYKPHYHWIPAEGERTQAGVTLHATICVACCGPMDWEEFAHQQTLTPERYRVQWSLNAPLPDRFLAEVAPLYAMQARHYGFN